MKKYKLTTQELTTHNGFQWEIDKKETTDGGGGLCGPGYLHYYHHPLLAVLLNPIHAGIKNPRLFEVEASGTHLDDRGLKGGCTEMTLLKEIELPTVTNEQRVAFSILCAKEVNKDKEWNKWADGWLSDEDRSTESASAAAYVAARASARASARSAYAAASAAVDAAAYAAAAYAAASAAASAAYAADESNINLIKLAEEAMKY